MPTRSPPSDWALPHVFVPLALGACLYVLWRPTDLYVFDWIRLVGMQDVVASARNAAAAIEVPDVVLYSAPGGLWMYSFVFALAWVFPAGGLRTTVGTIAVPLLLGLAWEFAQQLGALSGVFDALDVVSYLAGALCAGAVLVFGHPRFGKSSEEIHA